MLRLFLNSDQRLHNWDEKFHALVAKNMIEHPLKPTLYENTIVPYTNTSWVGNHVWLDKPPVPLWGMSASIAVFGTNTWAVRLPSLVYGLLAIVLTFLIGAKLFNQRVGVVAAFFHAIHGVIIELAAGKISSDHVETAFIFFVELGVFLIIYFVSVKQHYKITALIGLVIGLSFLSKWYPALILLPLWFVGILHCKKQLFFLVTHSLVLLLFAAVVIFPWVGYISTVYPEESGFVLNKFMGALTSPVEDHDAEWYYYILKMITLFGELIFIVLGFSIFVLLKRKYEWQTLILLVWILIPLVIFSFSETKRFTYLLIAAPAFFVLTANLWDVIYGKIVAGYKQGGKIALLLLLAFLPLRLTIERLKFFEFKKETDAFYTELPGYKKVLDDNDVVFGTEKHIEIMFFTDAAAAYVMLPDDQLIEETKAKGFDVYKMESQKLTRY